MSSTRILLFISLIAFKTSAEMHHDNKNVENLQILNNLYEMLIEKICGSTALTKTEVKVFTENDYGKQTLIDTNDILYSDLFDFLSNNSCNLDLKEKFTGYISSLTNINVDDGSDIYKIVEAFLSSCNITETMMIYVNYVSAQYGCNLRSHSIIDLWGTTFITRSYIDGWRHHVMSYRSPSPLTPYFTCQFDGTTKCYSLDEIKPQMHKRCDIILKDVSSMQYYCFDVL
jgi:hypothetical protein